MDFTTAPVARSRRATHATTSRVVRFGNFDQQGEAGLAFHHGCHRGEPALADDEVPLLTL